MSPAFKNAKCGHKYSHSGAYNQKAVTCIRKHNHKGLHQSAGWEWPYGQYDGPLEPTRRKDIK